MVNVRRLAAIDLHGLHGGRTRRSLVLTEFLVGAIAGVGGGIMIVVSSAGTPWQLAFGAWLAGTGLNYVPLALYALSLRRPEALAAELRGVPIAAELRRHTRLQAWVVVPALFVALAIQQRHAE